MIPILLASLLGLVLVVGAISLLRPRRPTMTDYLELPAPDPSEGQRPETVG